MAIVHAGSLSLQVKRCESERRFKERLINQIKGWVRQIAARCIEEALDAEVSELLGRAWYERQKGKKWRRVRAQCGKCQTHDARRFRRNGHYRRYLDTQWGRIRVYVPQVVCLCGGHVRVPFQTLRRGQRVWDDVEADAREQYGWGLSLREVKACVDAALQSSVSLRTLNQRVRKMAGLVPEWREGQLEDVPPVVRVDGLWVTLMFDTEETKKDRLGRRRTVKQGRKVPILVAQGVWPERGQQSIVAWVIGKAEDEQSWEALLTQMYERDICPRRGLRLMVADGSAGLGPARRTVYWDVPFQRCIFHKLRNVWRAIVLPEGLEGKAAQAYKRRFIRSAARIWQATTEKEACRRYRQFSAKWQDQQTQALDTLSRDFADTLTFYGVQAAAALQGQRWPAHHLRTTSLLEREFRAWRRRLSGALLFHSTSGLEAVVHQLITRRMFSRAHALPGVWQLSLERALAEAA
jgi:transposase-like protein